MARREGDTAYWLHNKLGSTDDLWSGRSICSQLTKEKLGDIVECFYGLQAHVKVKLLLSLLHINKRNLTEWKSELDEIIELAINDHDQWVSTTGEILKTFPATFLVNTIDLSGSAAFTSVFTDLKKTAKKSSDSSITPLEAPLLSKSALSSTIGSQPNQSRHFCLKRKSKSSALRQELLSKADDLQAIAKRPGGANFSIPMKSRSTAKRMDEQMWSNKTKASGGSGFLKANTLTSTFSSTNRTTSVTMRKEGGAKMLDISHIPPTGKEAKRRKKQEEAEAAAQAKKEKEEAAAAAAAAAKQTPDYAAGLGTTKNAAPAKIARISSTSANALPPTPSYLPNTAPTVLSNPTANINMRQAVPRAAAVQLTQQVQVPRSAAVPTMNRLTPAPYNSVQVNAVPRMTAVNNPPPTFIQHNIQTPSLQQTILPQQKKPLSLTKEQMVEAQDMFKNSNKVTRPEKALILGFMAGSRQNPCPQNGHIVNIKLNEIAEKTNINGLFKDVVSETYFQMNYQTGEWKRVKKQRELL